MGYIIVLKDGREFLVADSISASDASAKAVQRKLLSRDEFYDIDYIVENNQKNTEHE